jgi:ribosomal-protein-alanine N-acetyltransferase
MHIGTAMVEKLIGKLSGDRRNRIVLEVRETNLDAQLFFKNLGFRAISVLRDFYTDTTEDAYLMQFRMAGSQVDPLVDDEDDESRRMAG